MRSEVDEAGLPHEIEPRIVNAHQLLAAALAQVETPLAKGSVDRRFRVVQGYIQCAMGRLLPRQGSKLPPKSISQITDLSFRP